MSDKQEEKLDQQPEGPPPPGDVTQDDQLYEEPPRMTVKDTIGVIVALLALFVIGWLGYLWLTPGKSIGDALTFSSVGKKTDALAMAEPMDGAATTAADDELEETANSMTMNAGSDTAAGMAQAMAEPADAAAETDLQSATGTEPPAGEMASSTDGDTMDQPHLHDHEMRCASCGMFTDRSMSQVVGYWKDGDETHHDCWDCLFNYAADNGLELDHALVKLFNSSLEEPEWIRADESVYLFGTAPIKGSMPPFIAAFASRNEAEGAQTELGGEIMNFSDLKSNWE